MIVRFLTAEPDDTLAILFSINRAHVFRCLLKPIACQLAEALVATARYYLEVSKNRFEDDNTPLKGTAFILDRLKSEIERTNRYGTDLSLLLLDVQNLKQGTELYDNLTFKFLLEKLSEILLKELRTSDLAGRLISNLILILLPETGAGGAGVFPGRLLGSIRSFDKETNRGLLPFVVKKAQFTKTKNDKKTITGRSLPI